MHAGAIREEAHRDLDDEDDLHDGVEDVEDAPVALPQRGEVSKPIRTAFATMTASATC